jgi:type VI secretion system protein ImpG
VGREAAEAPYALKIQIRPTGDFKLSGLGFNSLRFFLGGEPQTAFVVYELLFNNVQKVIVRNGLNEHLTLERGAIAEVGFSANEAILPYPPNSFTGYRLLQEYFTFPQKFLFFDLIGLSPCVRNGGSGTLDLIFLISDFSRKDLVPLLEQTVNPRSFLLGCAPVVNLFERAAEPIRLSRTKTEYRVIPDLHLEKATEVYSVDRVVATVPYTEEPVEYQPFYSIRHTYGARPPDAFWHAVRRPSARENDAGTDVFLTLLDLKFKPHLPAAETLTAFVTCTNRDEVKKVHWSRAFGELEMEAGALCRARFVLTPTSPLRLPSGTALQWRLISHLSLNYLSIADKGADALREILTLYNYSGSAAVRSQIDGLLAVNSVSEVARVSSAHGLAFVRGLHTTVEFDEARFERGSLFLFSSILEKFLALYSSLHSFSKLSVVSRQRKGVLKVWPPRAGEQVLL